MQANWSLILNVLLLIVVVVAIGRLMKARRQSLSPEQYQPSLGTSAEKTPYSAPYSDDIIAVRKVSKEQTLGLDIEPEPQLLKKPIQRSAQPRLMPQDELRAEPRIAARTEPRMVISTDPRMEQHTEPRIPAQTASPRVELSPEPAPRIESRFGPRAESMATRDSTAPSTVMMFLLSKENRQFAGYELLQTVLTSGLRFGEGHLFHRHQLPNGQGPVLCTLAAATASGVFDLQNIGAFSVRGLCLFMQTSNNSNIDAERFSIMLETARQLSEGLDAYLLDDQRKPLTSERIARYYRLLNIEQPEAQCAMA